MPICLIIAVITILLASLAAKSVQQNASSCSKGPRRWPVVGSYFEGKRNFSRAHDWLLGYFHEDLKTFIVDWGMYKTIYTVDPQNVEYVLKTNFSNYPKGYRLRGFYYDLLGSGIFNSDDETWKRHRKLASYEFSSRKLNHFSLKVFQEGAIKLAEILDIIAKNSREIDFQDLCYRLTLDGICKISFGVDLGCLEPSLPTIPFAASFDRANELLLKRLVNPFWKIFRQLKIGMEKDLQREMDVVNSFTNMVIQIRKKEMEAHPNFEATHDDLLSRFMAFGSYNDNELRDTILNFILAGRDTTAITLSWFAYCLCDNVQVLKRIRSEGFEVLGDTATSSFKEYMELLTPIALRKMHYLHATLMETLRLYPAVPKDGKMARSDDTLPDGTRVSKGCGVTYVPYSMGRMEFLWGKDALQFKPERWLKEGIFQPESPFKFTAFQAGPRICLGKDQAILQMKIVAAMLTRFFTLELVQGHPVQYSVQSVMPMLHGLKLKVFSNN